MAEPHTAEPEQANGSLAHDLAEAQRFLQVLAEDAEAFTFQTFDDTKEKKQRLARILFGDLAEHGPRLCSFQKQGAGVFFVVNETSGSGRKKGDVVRVRAVFVDLDGAPLDPVMRCNLEPHVVIESSPGRYHAYWLVADFPLDQFEAVQRAIAGRFGGDGSICDLSRVMRLPGYWHLKGAPFKTRFVQIAERLPYSAAQILAEFPPQVAAAKQNGCVNGHDGGGVALAELIRQLLTAETFHDALRSLAWRYLAGGMQGGQVVETLRGYMLTIPEADRDDRWRARFAEIPRTVSTAQEKQRRDLEAEEKHAHLRLVQPDSESEPDPSQEETEEDGTGDGAHPSEKSDPGENKWKPRLIRGDKGPKDCVANGAIILEMDARFRNRLRFDEMFSAIFVRATPWAMGMEWRQWTDIDDLQFARWCQVRGVPLRPGTARDAVSLVSSKHKHHAVRFYLSCLAWDGTERLNTWLETYLGASAPNEEQLPYLRAVGPAFLISAVARIFKSGCKADHALILEGPQGSYKSSSIRALFGAEWFADEISDLGSKDSAQDLRGKWAIELAELSAMRRSQVERVKAFITRQVDHYRPSYGRSSQDFPRSCVFVGSTNVGQYLEDETGGRRFWPVVCGRIDVAAIEGDRDQLWAEAVVRFRNDEKWWLDADVEKLASAEQADRRDADAWEGAIAEWLEIQIGLHQAIEPTVGDILTHALYKGKDTWSRADSTRVGRCMHALGWKKKRGGSDGSRKHRYFLEEPAE